MVLRFAIVVMVSLGSVVRLLVLMCGRDVMMMSGTGFTGANLVMAFAFGDASRAAQQRPHEPQHRTRPRNDAEGGDDLRWSRCRHFAVLKTEQHSGAYFFSIPLVAPLPGLVAQQKPESAPHLLQVCLRADVAPFPTPVIVHVPPQPAHPWVPTSSVGWPLSIRS